MTHTTYTRTVWFCFSQLACFFFMADYTTAAEQVQAQPVQTPAVRRPDPRTGDLVPIAIEQIKPGKIYNHYSQLHNRYVWAYAKENGNFSYALGPGSTELPANFDLVTSTHQTQELVEAEAGPWAQRSQLQQTDIYVRLGTDNKWKVVRGRSLRSHYDLDSSRRWEWHGKRRVAVIHTHSNLWVNHNGQYLPF